MKNISGILKGINDKKISAKKEFYYIPSGFLRTVYNTENDFKKTAELFDTAQKMLANITFNDKIFSSKLQIIAAMSLNKSSTNFDETTENMKQVATELELRGSGKKFFENFA